MKYRCVDFIGSKIKLYDAGQLDLNLDISNPGIHFAEILELFNIVLLDLK